MGTMRLLVFFLLKVLILNTNVYSVFAKAPNDAENPVYLYTRRKQRNIHHEPRWQRTDETHTTSWK